MNQRTTLSSPLDSERNLAADVLAMLDRGEVESAKVALREVVGQPPRTPSPREAGTRLAQLACTASFGFDAEALNRNFGWNIEPAERPITNNLRHGRVGPFSAFPAVLPTLGILPTLRGLFRNPAEYLAPARNAIIDCTYQVSDFVPEALEQLGTRVSEVLNMSVATNPRERAVEQSSLIDGLMRKQAAIDSTTQRATLRLIVLASQHGMTQRQIASALGKNQSYVNRRLRDAHEEPSAIQLSPQELYDRHVIGQINRADLLALLAAYPYEKGTFPEDSREHGYVPGSADELTHLALAGSISRAELDLVLEGIDALRQADANA